MITIPLITEDLTKVRLTPSPLWETVGSFAVLVHHGRDTVHAPWVVRARRVLPGTDLSPWSPRCAWREPARTSLAPRPTPRLRASR
jgi:hypothetical protein